MNTPDSPAPTDTVLIRRYRPGDRADIRRICVETADAGEPLENFFADRELVGDLVTRYYTDFCCEYSWVAEHRATVVGYLTAAPDTVASQSRLRLRIGPLAFMRAIGRGLLFRRGTWVMAGVLLRKKGQWIQPPFHVPEAYPAHLHINLLKSSRGHHVGRELVEALFLKLKADNIRGVHATVRSDNARACSFFEHLEFKAISGYHEVLPAAQGVQEVHVTVYGRNVE